MFDSETMKAFQVDVTVENCFSEIDCSIDIATLIFVLSAIHPDKFSKYVVSKTEIMIGLCITKFFTLLLI